MSPRCYVYATARRKIEGPIEGEVIMERARAVADGYVREGLVFIAYFPNGGELSLQRDGSLNASRSCTISVVSQA